MPLKSGDRAEYMRNYRANKKKEPSIPTRAEDDVFEDYPMLTPAAELTPAVIISQQRAEIAALREEVKDLKRRLAAKPLADAIGQMEQIPKIRAAYDKVFNESGFNSRPFTPVPKTKERKAK